LFQLLWLVIVILGPLKKPASAQQNQSTSLNLHEAIKLALTNQPSLAIVQSQIDALNAVVGQAKAGLYPEVNLRGDVSYLSPVSKLSLGGNIFQIMPKKNYNVHVAAKQTVYNFGKTQASIQLAKSRTLTARQKREVVKWTISYFTAQTFYSILFEGRNLEVIDEQLSQLENDLKLAQKRHKFGAATNYDVLSIKVRIAEAKNNRRD